MQESTKIFIDVTHSYSYPFNTGVQRVVRKLAEQAKQWKNTAFIRFEPDWGAFIVLGGREIEYLLEGWKRTGPTATNGELPKSETLYRRILAVAKRTPFFVPLSKLKDTIQHRWIGPAWRRIVAWDNPVAFADLRNSIYLTAEVFGESGRVKAIRKFTDDKAIRTVFIVHDLIPHTHPTLSIMKQQHFQNYLSLLPNADLLVVDSEATLVEVRTFLIGVSGIQQPKLVRIYPGFDLIAPAKDLAPPRLLGLGRFFACIGTIEARKNQTTLLEVLELLWGSGLVFSFVFAGNIADSYAGFRGRFEELKSRGYPIRWLGHASEEEIVWLYRNAIATVYPSLVEGYGLPVVESVAHGTPCVASSSSSTGEIATLVGGCDIVDPLSVEEIRLAMQRLLEDSGRRQELIATFRPENLRTWKQYAGELHMQLRSQEKGQVGADAIDLQEGTS